MITEEQKKKAHIFQNLHNRNKMFVLPGAWSVGSAYIFEKCGFEAVGTSSAGIAYNLGYSDGEEISFDDYMKMSTPYRKSTEQEKQDILKRFGGIN